MPKRTAILIGNQVFRDDSGLTPLRGPHNDVARLSEILGDQQHGNFAVRTFLDQPHYEILPEIDETLGNARPGDLVLIYYSGHGKLDRAGRVCLATANTRTTALQATSIPALDIKRLVDQSDCDQVVLLLDCCYSGALDDLKGADVASEMHVIEDAQGFYILTASTGLQAAREEASVSGGAVMGKFTHALVDGIETGASDVARKGRIMLSDLRQQLEKVVSGQTPQYFARQAHGDPLISLSPSTAAPLLDPAIVVDLEASNWHHRAGAVTYLVNTMQSGIPAARQAARAVLERRLPAERDIDVRQQIEQGLSSTTVLLRRGLPSAVSPGPSFVQPLKNDAIEPPKLAAPKSISWEIFKMVATVLGVAILVCGSAF